MSRVPAAAALLLALLSAAAGSAPARVQFSKEVLPVLNRECAGCHRGSAAPGGYSMESVERLFGGGRHGKAIVPGNGRAGTLLRYLTGELKPQMPPGRPLPLDLVALVRRWIDEGARVDSMTAPAEPAGNGGAIPGRGPAAPAGQSLRRGLPLPAPVRQSAPATALAWAPDGRLLAWGGYRAVRLLEPASGAVVRTLNAPSGQVLSLAWSADGKRLAAAGGVAAAYGEICVWDAAVWGPPRTFREPGDAFHGAALRPGTAEIAAAGLDRAVRIWDTSAGKVIRTVRDHVDSVLAVAYSADGAWMATGSADRTVKLYRAASGERAASFGHADGVTALAFHPRGGLLAVAAEKQVRVWPVQPGAVENPLRGHSEGEAVHCLAFSADGGTFAWGAANRKVRIWNGEVQNQQRELAGCADWVYAVALSPDGTLAAAGAADGRVYFWDTRDGRLARTVEAPR